MEMIAERGTAAKPVVREINQEHMTESLQRKAGIWLDAQVVASKHQVSTQIVDLTPALAQALLNRNPKNRKLSERTVATYARDMANSAWVFNGEPVIVSRDGYLNDGQHRCEAVIRSDQTVKIVLIIGVDRESRTTLDQGKVRTVGDYLSMEGHPNANHLGTAASYLWQYERVGMISRESKSKPTKGETMHTIESNPLLSRSVSAVQKKGVQHLGGPALVAFCHFVFAQASQAGADEFLQGLIHGEGLPAGNPILYARNRLIMEAGWRNANAKAELIFKAWNAWRKGQSIQKFVITGGALPNVEN